MIRNLCVFIDGTMQDRSPEEAATDSNVVCLYNCSPDVDAGELQPRCYYRLGVGTRAHESITGGALGFGLDERITEAKMWLDDECAMALEDGCQPRLYLFGFSRGAFAVRVLATFLQQDIEFLGVWDTVKATPGNDFGISELPPYVKHACHAMAIDEHRSIFDVFRFKPVDRLAERWFSGSHTDVGGGYRKRELADITLRWMANQAVDHGLIVNREKLNLDAPVDLTMEPEIHNEDNSGWGITNVFKSRKWTIQRVIGVTDALDDTVLYIRDHWKDLISNDLLAQNQHFIGNGSNDTIA